MSTMKNSVLSDFKEAAMIPPKRRATWASRVLDEFIIDERRIIYAEFDTTSKAVSKYNALAKELKAGDLPFAKEVNVERRGLRVYLEKK